MKPSRAFVSKYWVWCFVVSHTMMMMINNNDDGCYLKLIIFLLDMSIVQVTDEKGIYVCITNKQSTANLISKHNSSTSVLCLLCVCVYCIWWDVSLYSCTRNNSNKIMMTMPPIKNIICEFILIQYKYKRISALQRTTNSYFMWFGCASYVFYVRMYIYIKFTNLMCFKVLCNAYRRKMCAKIKFETIFHQKMWIICILREPVVKFLGKINSFYCFVGKLFYRNKEELKLFEDKSFN